MSNVPNLDCMSEEDLRTFWYKNYRPTAESIKELFGHNHPGYDRVSERLANYAINKSSAMNCRIRGDIKGAKAYEDACDIIYGDLPDDVRW